MSVVVDVLMVAGAVVMFLGALGVFRMPDVYNRMQASSKASSLGVALLLLAVGLHFAATATMVRAAAVILFVFLTVPVAAHVLARAAHRTGVAPWDRTRFDQLRAAIEEADESGPRGNERAEPPGSPPA